MSIGSRMHVDAFSPNTKASITMRIIPTPFIPDLAKPVKQTAKLMAIH